MRKRKICMCPFESMEISALEFWLDSHARQGWQLQTFRGAFAVFAASEPDQTRMILSHIALITGILGVVLLLTVLHAL